MLVLPWTGASVSEADWHWAVGIWEGEGCIGVYNQTHHGGKRIRLEISSTDLDILEACATHFDFGRLFATLTRSHKHKQGWTLRETRRDVVSEWCRLVLPDVRALRRRQQIQQVLRWCEEVGPAGKSGKRHSKVHGRAVLEENKILGLTDGQ